MFDFLRGEVARKGLGEVVVDVNGVGYLLSISAKCEERLPSRGSVTLFVQVQTNDAGTRLFGFLDEQERLLFRQLLGVRGVGPAVALTLLSQETPDALAGRIRAGDVKGLTRIKGIGTKTAERLVVELKNVVAEGLAVTLPASQEESLLKALQSLGLDSGEALARTRAVLAAHPADAPLELLLRAALKSRSAGR